MSEVTTMTGQRRRRWRTGAAALVSAALIAAWPLVAAAQEFQKVEGAPRQEVPAGPFVGIAYAFIWVAVLVYVCMLARGLGRIRGELDDLRRKLGGPRP